MTAVPIISPIAWPPVRQRRGVIGWFLHHLSFRRRARMVYDSVLQQLSARPSPRVPWPSDSVEARIAATLTQHLNDGQFFGSYSYHPDGSLLLLSVHPVDDMTLVEATIDLEQKFGVKIERDLHTMTFGEAVSYVASLFRKTQNVA